MFMAAITKSMDRLGVRKLNQIRALLLVLEFIHEAGFLENWLVVLVFGSDVAHGLVCFKCASLPTTIFCGQTV